MNYAETLMYWYLRLNGFFPLSRFVLHQYPHEHADERVRNADCDLVALRLPHVFETVGGQANDWHPAFFASLGADPTRDTIGLIIEVKGGQSLAGVETAFEIGRTTYALRRLGLFPLGETEAIGERLMATHSYRRENLIVVKVLAAHALEPTPTQTANRTEISIKCINEFIEKRMSKYRDEKIATWNFFPSDLLQYIIWREKVYPRPADH